MKKIILSFVLVGALFSCSNPENATNDDKVQDTTATSDTTFNYVADQFADLRVLRYQIPGFDQLTLKQKKLAYYLTQAGLSGRDIIWDQNFKYNLEIRSALENIVRNYKGTQNENWKQFMVYVKRVWFSNGIHHHYSTDKFIPEFSKDFLNQLLSETKTTLSDEAKAAIFNPELYAKRVNLDASKGLIKGSAENFYGANITSKMVDDYYRKLNTQKTTHPLSYGLNTQLVLENGKLIEKVWKVGGMYSDAIKQIVFWLEKAVTVAENDQQKKALQLLIKYYKTGDLETWNQYGIAWVNSTKGDIDWINGFIEVYGDPKGYKATYESIVQMKDFEATKRMKVLADHAQWFEDHSPIMGKHKKKNVTGVTYNVVNAISEAGATSPSTPIGVNLPNEEWIRQEYGSKSVSLGNIINAYHQASGGTLVHEFTLSDSVAQRDIKYGTLASKLHTAMHEVIGHASGKIDQGIGSPKATLKSYASALEEARADLVGLYFLMDPKLIELGLMKTLEVGKAQYDSYIRNGLMTQLKRIHPGNNIEEAHMRDRQLICKWVYEKGLQDNVIEKIVKEGKTYFVINDYKKLRTLFGDLLREIQRIKSEGDYAAGKALVENYGVKVDQELHKEVLKRFEPLDIAPYGGFINPVLVPVKDEDGNITDINVQYPDNFKKQMLHYADKYGFLAK